MSEPIGVDASGYEVLTRAVIDLINTYPYLDGKVVTFEELKTNGIAVSADNGALIIAERRSITDHIWQRCSFPFFVVYRSASTRSNQKVKVSEFLDTLGKWVCGETAVHNGTSFSLDGFPELSGGRKITRITRSNSYGVQPQEDGTQDFLLPVVVEYENEFDLGF